MKKHTDPNARLGGELMSAKVVERLAAELKTGRYAGQDRLPAEVELAAQLGVSRTVVRDALSELEREGFVERVRGIGTVVNRDVVALENRADHKLEFYSMIRARGCEPRSDHLDVTREAADAPLAESLDIRPGDTVLRIHRRVFADDVPVIYSSDAIPLALFDQDKLAKMDLSRPVFDLLEQAAGQQTASTVAHIRAVTGDAQVRRLLSCGEGQALLMLDETFYSRLCRPILHCNTYYTDFFDFSIVRKLM